jgi:murein DD-endopeptidase MepM/ murein hydrolase activator NlpD
VTLRAPAPALRATRSVGEQPPQPTAIPAPTTIPAIHIVQPGETLIDIAQEYGVTLDALQAANGVLKPETLQIGQRLIIPLGPGAPSTSGGLLLPTPAPLPVSVQGAALYETPVGSLVVQGEILNTSGAALENTQVRVALLNDSGEEVAAATAFTTLEVIPIDGKSPFGVLFAPSGVPPGVASFAITPIRAEASTEPGSRYLPIVVTGQEGAVDGLQFKVKGSVANQGSAAATGVNVVLTTYDDTGRVTGFRQATVGDGTLPAGATAEFEISIAPNGLPGLPPADYALAAQGQATQP